MRPFNLAETRIAERTYCRRQMSRRLKTIAVLVALTVCVAAAAFACRIMITTSASRAASELADAQGRCAQIKKQMAAVRAQLSRRVWLDQLAKASGKWLKVLNAAMVGLPEDVWLSKIETSDKECLLALEGHAASYESLSAYVARLRQNPAFSEVRLGSTRLAAAGGTAYISFALQAMLPTPAASASNPAPAPVQSGQVPNIEEAP